MEEHAVFYFPYASFGWEQAPLLRAVALYFDRLYLLDPEKARGTGTGPLTGIGRDVLELEAAGLLVRLSPEDVLEKHGAEIEALIRADMADPEFYRICEESGRGEYWTLALAKVPKGLREAPSYAPRDRAMQRLMGSLPGEVAEQSSSYSEVYAEVNHRYREVGGYVETSLDASGRVGEFRQADFPLPLGESIMVNHALVAGLLGSGAIPLTDDSFHHRVLAHKINRIANDPQVRRLAADALKVDHWKADVLATRVFQEDKLALPSLSPGVPIGKVLEVRRKHDAELTNARTELAWLAQEIRNGPWTQEFEDEVRRDYLPRRIRPALEELGKAQSSWVKTVGLAATAAASTIALFIAGEPLMSVATASSFLAAMGDDYAPLLEDLGSRHKSGKKRGPGLSYLMVKPWK